MPVVQSDSHRAYGQWKERVRALARSMGLPEAVLDEGALRDGYSVGDTPAEFCMGALIPAGDGLDSLAER